MVAVVYIVMQALQMSGEHSVCTSTLSVKAVGVYTTGMQLLIRSSSLWCREGTTKVIL